MTPHTKLKESVEHLRGELHADHPLSEADRRLLDQTLADVNQMLDDEQEDPSFGDAIYEELRELSVRLEEAHPNLSVIVGRIVDGLSQLGV